MKARTSVALAFGIVGVFATPLAFAQTFVGSNTTAQTNTADHIVTVTLNPESAAVDGVEMTATFNTSHVTLPAPADIVSSTPTITCSVSAPTVTCSGFGIAAGVQTIQIPVDIGATLVPAPGSPVTIAGRYLDALAEPVPVTATNGSIVINDAPPTPLTLSYVPGPGPITLPSGSAGTTVNTNIVATATGNSGSASLSCSAAAGFTVTPNLTFNSAGDQNIAVGCTLGAAQTTGNITCTEIDGNDVAPGATRTWTATCPQGGVVPVNPTITTVTATGAFAMPSGALGQTVSRLIDFSASGGAGTGSATINCTATAPVTVTPAMQTVTGSAQPTDVAVRLQLTNAAQGPFDVVCTVTSGSTVRTDTFNVTAAAGTALPPPTVVPASSTWSQLLLIALMAGLGLAFVGFRRQS